MKKAGLTLTIILFSLFLILPSLSFAHDDEHGKQSDHGQEPMGNERYEEGSGSSALKSSHEGKEYKSNHEEAKEEGSFSYKRHRKEMKQKKAMEEGMANPASTDSGGKMAEGSGKR